MLGGVVVPTFPVSEGENKVESNDKLCDDCKQFITDLESIVTNATTEVSYGAQHIINNRCVKN